jgi:amino acid adenylation domain-containing protein
MSICLSESPLTRAIFYLQQQIARIAGISADQVDVQQSLSSLGFDSLMAVELRSQLTSDWAVDIPLPTILEERSIAHLADLLQESGQLQQAEPDAEIRAQKPLTGRYPLSQGQWGLWFLQKLVPNSAAYNLAFTARIRSQLNTDALKRSLQVLIDRHATLRTTYSQIEDEPFQEIHPTQPLDFEQIDASNWDEPTLARHALQVYQYPFDLEVKVLRASLFTQSPQHHIFILNIHHIAIDGVSFGVLLDELQQIYQAENTGQAIHLPVIRHQYSDFVQWQREIINSPAGEKLWQYWRQQLANVTPLDLPTDRSQSPLQSRRGASYSFELDQTLTSQLRALAKRSGVTLYMTMLAAFQVLLYRSTGQEDLVIGTPASGRSEAKFSRTVGFFVNVIALRTNLAGNPTFIQLLEQVRSIVLEAVEHQSYPAPILVKRLGLKRDLSQPGLFRATFNLLNLPKMASDFELSISKRASANWGDLRLEAFEIPQQEEQNDLVFDVLETVDRLVGIFRYRTNLFDASTVRRLAERFQAILVGIVENPAQAIDDLPILTLSEETLLKQKQWSSPKANYPTYLCIHQLFEAQVERTPDAIAVVCNQESLTYRQLNTQAAQLARCLQSYGVAPEVRVGICLERSVMILVAVLAVLKAGGVYVPLDPNYPSERLSFMLSDAEVALLLTQPSLESCWLNCSVTVLRLDSNGVAVGKSNNTDSHEPVSPTPDNLSYIVYTSGSTGRAKGVMIEHRSLVNAYFAWADAYALSSLSSHLQMASFSFDVFTGDWVRALCSGAKLVLCPQDWLLEPGLLYSLMQTEAIDIAEFGPAVLRNLMLYLRQTGQMLRLQKLIVGSDAFYVQEYQQLRQLCEAETRLINSYGVSEATIDSTYYEMSNLENATDEQSVNSMVPIGRPFFNTEIYILDASLNFVPIGVTGELHIGGAGLARGYLNASELTQQPFIRHPFSSNPNARLYKTGDLARCRNDGTIEYVGRADTQVKLRGFRIELGEIEAALLQHPAVQQSVVAIQENATHVQSLVAYLVTEAQQEQNYSALCTELRSFLKHKLPEPMLPSAFVLLNGFPLTANGKIDRRALPQPDQFQRDLETSFVAPRSLVEKQLTDIWQSVLKLDRVSIHDSFFELGGHSLLATQVVVQLRQIFQIELPLRYLFESPTIADLSNRIEQCQPMQDTNLASSLLKRSADVPIPLTQSQQYIWHLQQLDNVKSALNSSIVMRLKRYLTPEVLERSCNEILRRHEILRTVFTIVDREPVQVVLPTLTLKVIYADLQSISPETREAEAVKLGFEIAHPLFDLEVAPLIRVALFQLAPEEHWILITAHHLIIDGESFSLLLQELDALIQSSSSSSSSPLLPLEFQYGDFAVWQRQVCTEAMIEKQLKYWRNQLIGSDIELSESLTQPVQNQRIEYHFTHVSESIVTAIDSISRSQNVTRFVVLLAALKITLSAWSRQHEIMVVGTVGNRSLPETDSMIGCFINDVILRSQLLPEQTGLNLLHQLRDTVNEAIEHKEVPLQRVIEQIRPYRSLNLMASLTLTAVQNSRPLSDWETVDLQNYRSQWKDLPSALFDEATPLELYVEVSKTARIVVKYNAEQFTATTIEQLFTTYQAILAQLATYPGHTLLEFFQIAKNYLHEGST